MYPKIVIALLLAAALPAVSQQPNSASPAGDATAPVLTLADVLRRVQQSNPALSSAASAVAAQRRRATAAGALPDPNVTVSYMGSPAPFKTMSDDPSSYRGVSAMQMLPLGGKRELQREMARREARVSETDQLAISRRLTADAKAAYYDYFYYSKALEITERNKQRLHQLADISEARYKVGKAMQSDVLRANVELSMLLQRAVTFEQQRETAAARLNTLMGQSVDAPLGAPTTVAKDVLPDVSALLPAAQTNDPMLQKEQAMVERNNVAVTMARKESIPDLSVGYMYQQRSAMPDMYGLQFTVNIPIFNRGKRQEAVEAAKLDVTSAEQSREARKLELAYELKQMHSMAVNAAKMLDLYDNAILPQAELALESARSSYTVGTSDFLTVVTNFSTIHGYELDYYRQLADYEIALARIEALTGDLNQVTKEAK